MGKTLGTLGPESCDQPTKIAGGICQTYDSL